MWQAIRHRRGQSLVLVLLSAVVVASAAVGPLYARALSHSVLKTDIDGATPEATRLLLETAESGPYRPDPDDLTVPESLTPFFHGGRVAWETSLVTSGHIRPDEPVRLPYVSLGDACAHLVVRSGRCPTAADEVLVAATTARQARIGAGDTLTAIFKVGIDDRDTATGLRIVGTYDQRPEPGYWLGLNLSRRMPLDDGGVRRDDTVIVSEAFFTEQTGEKGRKLDVRVTREVPLDRAALGVDDVAEVRAALEALAIAVAGTDVTQESGLGAILERTQTGLDQGSWLVTLLLAQLALLALAVLSLGAAAAVDARRPEMALARLRGRGRRGANALVVRELGTLVLCGLPIGFAVALLATEVARATWLPGGASFEVPRASLAAAGLATLLSLLVVGAATRPRVNESISSLLRRVPSRQRGAILGVADTIVITLAVAGFLTIVNGDASGPVALATPVTLALATGMSLALVVVPVSRWLGRRSLERGQVARALITLSIARRPAVRRVVAIGCVSTALLCFAADAFLVAQRAREDRARVEAGAEHVLFTDAVSSQALRDAVAALPAGTASPVAMIDTASGRGQRTVVVDSDTIGAVAFAPGVSSENLAALRRDVVPTPLLRGPGVDVTVANVQLSSFEPLRRGAGVLLSLDVRGAGGQEGSILLPPIGARSAGETVLHGESPVCADACLVTGIQLRQSGSQRVKGRIEVVRVTSGAGMGVDFSRSAWEDAGITPDGDPIVSDSPSYLRTSAPSTGGPALVLDFYSDIGTLTSAFAPPPVPVVHVPARVGAPATPGYFAGFDGIQLDATVMADAELAPGGWDDTVIVDWDVLTDTVMTGADPGTLSLWLSPAGDVAQARHQLAARGISVTATRDRSEIEAGYGESAAARSLRLTFVIGLLAVALTMLVIVLVSATSVRTRARDGASLRMAGVREGTLRSFLMGEQLVVVLIASVVGAVCGFVGARLTLPMLPLFTVPSEVVVPDLTSASLGITLTAVGSGIAFAVVGVVLGRWLLRRGDLVLVKEQVQ